MKLKIYSSYRHAAFLNIRPVLGQALQYISLRSMFYHPTSQTQHRGGTGTTFYWIPSHYQPPQTELLVGVCQDSGLSIVYFLGLICLGDTALLH